MEPQTKGRILMVEHHKHPWKARFIIAMIMLILSFIGLIYSQVSKDGSWNYWRFMAPIFAILCLFLSWYLRRKKHSFTLVKAYHEILHWVGLLVAVYLVSYFVNIGILGRFEASLQVITLLALTTFLAGVYIEFTFIPLGLLLGAFAASAAFVSVYLYAIMVPLTIVVAGVLFFLSKRKHKKKPITTKPEEEKHPTEE